MTLEPLAWGLIPRARGWERRAGTSSDSQMSRTRAILKPSLCLLLSLSLFLSLFVFFALALSPEHHQRRNQYLSYYLTQKSSVTIHFRSDRKRATPDRLLMRPNQSTKLHDRKAIFKSEHTEKLPRPRNVIAKEKERLLYCPPAGPNPLYHQNHLVDRPCAMGF